MSTPLVVLATVLGWNAVFVLTAEHGVLPFIAGLATLLGAAALWVAGPAARARWASRPARGVLLGAAAGVALAGASWAGWMVRDFVPIDLTPQVEGLYAVLRRPPGPVLGFPLMVLTIAGEELVFRGLLQDALRSRLGSAGAVGASAVLYTLANLGSGTWILPVVALALGALWGLMAERSRGLWLPLACHLVWDAAVFAVVPLVPG